MKHNCNFQMNPAFAAGVTLLWAGIFVRNVLELEGPLATAVHFLSGVGVGMAFVGLLYGSPKTRPLFRRLHAFKLRLLGRDESN